MDHAALRLAELLAGRICHDLAGPLGGLAVALPEAAREPEAMEIAQDAALALRCRLALARAAWGEAAGPLDAAGLVALAAGLGQAHRLRLSVELRPAGSAFAPAAGRVALNALLLGAEALPRGGALELSGAPAGVATLRVDGPGAGWPEGLAAWLADPALAWAGLIGVGLPAVGRGLQGRLLAVLAAAAGVRLSLGEAAGGGPAPLWLECGPPGDPR